MTSASTLMNMEAAMDFTGHLSWFDYLIYVVVLFVSVAIGVYYGCIHKKQTVDELFTGGNKMAVAPMALSIAASFMSAISLIGIPSEIYRFGTTTSWTILSILLGIAAANRIYIPIFYKLHITSAYQYLEMRFHRSVRRLASGIVILQLIFYMAMVVYAPSLALSQMTGMDVITAVTLTFAVAILYTALGGIKAVVWTDVLQLAVMLISLATIIIKATIDFGGMGAVFRDNFQGKRIEFFM